MGDAERMQNTVILITADGMGRGDVELQRTLVAKYMGLLAEHDLLPNSICFYTDGVRLAVSGSPVLELLRVLERRGVRLILCSTCLAYYGLSEQVQVGIVGGMADILTAQARADRVITL
ncbi:MAG: DsrE family protein [Anaerolineaceae bacterium]|jgi:sulfur relay (sulfurtransferase) complex TusBCD TusD component (DsrE family)